MGRKPQYTEKTETVSFRVPKSKVDELKKSVDKLLDQWRANTNPSAEIQNTCDCYMDGRIMKRGKSGCKKPKEEHHFY